MPKIMPAMLLKYSMHYFGYAQKVQWCRNNCGHNGCYPTGAVWIYSLIILRLGEVRTESHSKKNTYLAGKPLKKQNILDLDCGLHEWNHIQNICKLQNLRKSKGINHKTVYNGFSSTSWRYTGKPPHSTLYRQRSLARRRCTVIFQHMTAHRYLATTFTGHRYLATKMLRNNRCQSAPVCRFLAFRASVGTPPSPHQK